MYPVEELGEDYDDGTMPDNVDQLRQAVVGQRIVKAERTVYPTTNRWAHSPGYLEITLSDGRVVEVADTDDCCAFTELEAFFLDPSQVDHVITGVGTTDGYTTWHIFCDYGDVLKLKVDWSPGNPFYYGYGFTINVREKGAEHG